MKCIKCGAIDVMLHRTSPKGEAPANWTCLPCIEKVEPELANNIKEDKELIEIGNILTTTTHEQRTERKIKGHS